MNAEAHANDTAGKKNENFFVFVDGEKFFPQAAELTPSQIIADGAHLDPATHYLIKRKGHEQTSYQNDPNSPIHLEKADRFEVISTGATPVS